MIFLKFFISFIIFGMAVAWYFIEVYFKNPRGVVVWTVPVAIILTTIVAIGAIWTNL